mgnify:CR=1 FL=1
MSIRSEIRAALVDGPKSTDEMLPLVPSVEGDRARLGQNVSVLANELKVRRAGLSDDGRPLYQLDPQAWPAKGDAGETVTVTAGRIEGPQLRKATPPPKPAKATKPAKAPKKARPAAPAAPAKSQRQAAKVQRKTAKPRAASPGRAVTVATEPDWRVGLQLDGSVFAFDPAAGTHQVIAAPIVRQILGMAALLRPAG